MIKDDIIFEKIKELSEPEHPGMMINPDPNCSPNDIWIPKPKDISLKIREALKKKAIIKLECGLTPAEQKVEDDFIDFDKSH